MRYVATGARIFSLLLVPVLMVASPVLSQEHSPLMGAWIVTAWENSEGEVLSEPQPGLFIFTQNHYSIMHVNTDEPRPGFQGGVGEATAAQLGATYGPFTANSGRYEMSGDQIIRQAYVAKNPGVMNGFPDNDVSIQFHVADGGDVLHLTYGNGNIATLRQVDGLDSP